VSIGPDARRRATYEAVFAAVYEPLQRYVRRRAPVASADDVVADALLVLWQRLDDVPTEAAVPWAYGVARRCLANERRGSRRRLALVDRMEAQPPRAATPSGTERDDELEVAMTSLSPDDREILRLWAWEQLAPREIATVLDITANAASIRLHRAKAKLAARLDRKIASGAGHIGDASTEEAT
jgi:RNA polymerase sigma-70 factor (ECF subfamily)